ncbi:MAG: type 4 prepilin peptidase 1 [Rhodospirillales bacterium]|nr:type 4 prepilin peptidase 1 [Rhodospirillales bacterium]
MPDWLAPVILSPFVGSFLGVLIRRLPAGEDVVAGRSHCESCGRALGPVELVPLLNYLILRGKCRHCGGRIGLFHPAIELAALAVAVWAACVDDGARLWADCVLGWTLLALGWIDARHMVLPDVLTLPLILAGLGFALIAEPDRILDHAAGAAVGWLIFWAVARLYRALRRREGLGEGDAKLLAAAGAWVTWSGLGAVMLLAAVTGLLIALAGRLRGGSLAAATAIPFGPPLAFAIWVVWLYAPLIQ